MVAIMCFVKNRVTKLISYFLVNNYLKGISFPKFMRPYEESFEYWESVSSEFEKHVTEDRYDIYGSVYFIPGSMRLYLIKDNSSRWGRFSKEGDISLHWHLAALDRSSSEKTLKTGLSLIRDGAVLYSNVANYAHTFVPITPDSLIKEINRESEKLFVAELERIVAHHEFS
ncbi:MAG: hypothetical protein ACP5N2_03485 [Candidatus Nanoarchaeia archaeon]